MVTLTVSDGLGHSDTVHFVFNEAGQGPVTLTGTSGKDVIFATGSDDTLTGGASADQFVFAPGQNPSADTITDFTPGQDRIDLRLFSEVGADNINGWLSTHAVQSSTNPADVLITLGNDSSHAEERRRHQPACQRLHRVAASRYLVLRLANSHWLRDIDAIFWLVRRRRPGEHSEAMKRLRVLRRWFARRIGYARLLCLALLIGFAALRAADPAPVEEIRVRTFDAFQRIDPRKKTAGRSPSSISTTRAWKSSGSGRGRAPGLPISSPN